jgi:hypothetical protein
LPSVLGRALAAAGELSADSAWHLGLIKEVRPTDTILVKILRPRSAKSCEPQVVKTHSVAARNQAGEILRAGCAHMKQAFDIESINIDDLNQFCESESNANPIVDLGQIIEFFNGAAEWWH